MFLAGGFMGIWSRFDHVYLGMSHRKNNRFLFLKKSQELVDVVPQLLGHISFRCTLGPRFLNPIPGFWDQNSLSVGERHLLTHSPVVLAKKTSLLWWKFPLSWFIPHCSWLHTDINGAHVMDIHVLKFTNSHPWPKSLVWARSHDFPATRGTKIASILGGMRGMRGLNLGSSLVIISNLTFHSWMSYQWYMMASKYLLIYATYILWMIQGMSNMSTLTCSLLNRGPYDLF